ncbi:MAG: hypothetical protein M1833_004742 [Piccolia ochrophora]|nr:MAG: hypothetical protein M1833_004742 [Piccolia ochrophora]
MSKTLALLLSCFCLVHIGASSPTTPATLTELFSRAPNDDPDDLSWIRSYAAVGDSYSSGLGAGNVLKGKDDEKCSRYDGAYPVLFKEYLRLADDAFHFVACKGHTSEQIIDQVKNLPGNHDLITVTAGGNDVHLSDVLLKCFYLPNTNEATCDKAIQEAEREISTNLEENIDKLLTALQTRIKPAGLILWTLYAKFFNPDTDPCSEQSWAVFDPTGNGLKLTKERRQKMNQLVEDANLKIQRAIASATGSTRPFVGTLRLVKWDNYVKAVEGRFCEKDSSGDPNHISNLGLMFQRFNTPPTNKKRALARRDTNPEITEKAIDEKTLPDSLGKVFHPSELGQSLIATFNIGGLTEFVEEKLKLPDIFSVCPIDDGPGDDDPGEDEPGQKHAKCYSDDSTEKWTIRNSVKDLVDWFCFDDEWFPDGKQGDKHEMTGEAGTPYEFKLTVEYSKDAKVTSDECVKTLMTITDGCDGVNNPNNVKHGGEWEHPAGAKFSVVPMVGGDRTVLNCRGTKRDQYMNPDTLNKNIGDFCKNVVPKFSHGTVGLTLVETYNEKTPDEVQLAVQMLGSVWKGDKDHTISEEECKENMGFLKTHCDGNDPENPLDFKHGGHRWAKDVQYEYLPFGQRRAIPAMKETKAKCTVKDKVFFFAFQVWGGGFSTSHSGRDPDKLFKEIRGCGVITKWRFKYFDKPDENGYEWFADGQLPVHKLGCVGRAIGSAGGPKPQGDELRCDGGAYYYG